MNANSISQAVHTIAIAEDDEDDRILIEDAFVEGGIEVNRIYCQDGVELFEYLRGGSEQTAEATCKLPSLILLDLNMPRMDGPTTLAKLKADPLFRRIPVVVLTTSNASEHIEQIYDSGACSFVSKPVTFDDLVRIIKTIHEFWFVQSHLPTQRELAHSI